MSNWKPDLAREAEARDTIDYQLALLQVTLSWCDQAVPRDTPLSKRIKEAQIGLETLKAKLSYRGVI